MNTRNGKGALAGAQVKQFPNVPPAHSSRDRVRHAREVLRDAIVASGVQPFQASAIEAAAESLAKERVRAELASLAAELEPPTGAAA